MQLVRYDHNISFDTPEDLKNQIDFAQPINQIEHLAAIGGVIGLISTYVYYPLGQGFGTHVYQWLHIADPRIQRCIEVFFGGGAMVPMGALGILSSYDVTKKIAQAILLPKEERKEIPKSFLKRGIFAFSVIFGVFSSCVRFYLTIQYLSEANIFIKILLIPPSFLTPFAIGTLSVEQLFSSVAKKFISNKYVSELDKFIQFIELSATESDIDEITTRMNNGNLFTTAIEESEKIIVEDRSKLEQKKNLPKKCVSGSKAIAGYLGFIVGALANYAFFLVAYGAGTAFCKLIFLSSKIIQVACGIIFVIMFLIPSVALRGLSTKDRFESPFLLFSKETYQGNLIKKVGLKALSTVGGFFAATPITFLAIETALNRPWYEKAFIVPAFLSPFSVSTFSIEKLFSRLKKNEEISSKETVKKQLINTLKQLKSEIQLISEFKLANFIQRSKYETIN